MPQPLAHLPVTNGKCIARVICKHWPEPHLSPGLLPTSAVKLSIWPRVSVGLGSLSVLLVSLTLTPLMSLMSCELLQIYALQYALQ